MKILQTVLLLLTVFYVRASENGLQQYWKFNFESDISATGIIDMDFSQDNEVVTCTGNEVKYYTHDGTSYVESETITKACTSVAISKGPHFQVTTGDTMIMIGDSATSYVYFYKKEAAASATEVLAHYCADDMIGMEVALPTGGKYAATVGKKRLEVFTFNDDSWGLTHTELMSDNDEILHVDVNHDDVLVVSAENKEVRWYRVRFSSMELIKKIETTTINIGKAVASTVSCRGSQVAYTQNNGLVVYLQDIDVGSWNKVQTISGDIQDVEMSLCMIAVTLPSKVQLWMLEKTSTGAFGTKYILTKEFHAKEEVNYGKKIAFKLSDLAILSDDYLSFHRNSNSAQCRKDEFINGTSCDDCPAGTFNPRLTTNTDCSPLACAINERSFNGGCVACPPGTTNDAGDTTDADTDCDVVTCAVDEYVNNQNQCGGCPAGTTTNGNQYTTDVVDDSVCDDILCKRNEYVESNECKTCATGSTAAPNAKASGADTQCLVGKCGVNEYVQDSECFPCAPGSTSPADLPLTGGNTNCEHLTCSLNQRVNDHACEACGSNSIRAAGDKTISSNTYCTCIDNHYTDANGDCQPCAAGKAKVGSTAKPGSATTCSDIMCNNDQYVLNNECKDCNTGSHFTGKSKASGEDTYCYCDEGYRSDGSRLCSLCPAPSYMKPKGDKTDVATSCFCSFGYKASGSNTCVQCPTGSERNENDDPNSGTETFCTCTTGFRAKGDGTCEECAAGYTTLNKVHSQSTSICLCAENYRVSSGSCVACFSGATRAAGDNPTGDNTYCAYEGKVRYMGFDTDKFTSTDSAGNVLNNPTLTMRVGTSYSLVRSSIGSPLRVLSATDCPDCVNGVVPSPVPASSVVASDSRAPESGVDESVAVVTPTEIGTLYYVSTDGSATVVGEIIVKFEQCSTIQSSGSITLSTSCVLKGTIELSGDLTIEADAAASRRFKLRGGDKIIISGDNTHPHFIVKNGHKLTLKNLDIKEGYNTENGGSISVDDGKVTIENSIIRNNNVANGKKGGAIYAKTSATISISGSTVENNKAEGGSGGAIYLDEPDTANNKEVGLTMGSTILKNNQADEGGSVSLAKESSLTCEACEFDANEAKSGGAVYGYEKNNINVDNSEFKNNKATEKYGGAIKQLSCSSSQITASNFDGNEAKEGGAGLYSNYETGDHACSNTLTEIAFDNNVVTDSGKKGGAALFFGAADGTLAGKLTHVLTASNFTGNTEGGVSNDVSWSEASAQTLKCADQDLAVGLNGGPTIPSSCHKHACFYKPLASTCSDAGAGKIGVKCGCDMGTNTISADTSLKKTQMKTVISILFANEGVATDIIRTVDDNNRYVPPKGGATPEAAKAAAEAAPVLAKPINKEGEAVGEKTVLMKPVEPGKTLCTSFQSWLCEKVTACSSSDGTVTIECDGVVYFPSPASRRRLLSDPEHARMVFTRRLFTHIHEEEIHILRSGNSACIDTVPPSLQQQCSGLDSDGNAFTYDRCVPNALMGGDGFCVCADGFVVAETGDACDSVSTTCRRDEHVVSGECMPCAEGTYNLEGDSVELVDSACDDNYCPVNYHVVNGQCSVCPVGEHTPGYDDKNIVGGTSCCKGDEYEYTATSPNINNNGGSDRVCKKCYGNTDPKQDVETRFTDLRCCLKGYDTMCNRILHGYNEACQDEATSTCNAFVKYGVLQQGEACVHNNECDSGVCSTSTCD